MQKLLTAFLALFFLGISWVQAQTGSIKGSVKDAKTNEEIIGAIVKIPGTSYGAPTDINGFYKIDNVPVGTHKLEISSLSYTTKTLPAVVVAAGKTATSNVVLEDNSASLSEVVVVAERRRNTEMAVLAEMREAKIVVSAISGEQIARTQDRDAAQVVRRIPGVTIINNRFIMVRGLSERYNSVMLNNTFAPSLETDVKSFSFDVIPSSQIDRVLIYKSPSAELPGDFAGGMVKIFTKSIPNESSLVLDYSMGIREGTTFNPFFQQQTGKLHWTGFNEGYNDLPSTFPADLRKVNDHNVIQQAGRSLNNNWVARPKAAIPDQRVGLVYNGRFNLRNIEVGNVTAINYSNSFTRFSDMERGDFDAYRGGDPSQYNIYTYQDEQYNQTIRTGFIHNWAFRFNPRHVIEFKNLYNQLGNTQYVQRSGYHQNFNYYPDNGSFDQTYRGLYVGQLTGKHSLKVDDDFKDLRSLDWTVAYGYSYRDQPDYRRYRRDLDPQTGVSTLYISRGVSPEFLGRFYSEMYENSISSALNYNHKLELNALGALNPTVSTGFFFENKNRNFTSRNMGYVPASFDGFEFFSDTWALPMDQVLRPENINTTNGLRIDEQSNASDNYTSSNLLGAGYASVSMPLSAKLSAVAGVRLEHNQQQLNSRNDRGPVNVNNPVTSVLPSANVSYSLTEKMLLRAAYGLTVNRPEFRELAPFGYYDFNFNYTLKGNENLQTASVQNADIRWEFYPTASELVSVGVFNKQFTNAIERAIVPGAGSGGAKTFTFLNAPKAFSRGVEVDLKKSFAGMTNSRFLDDLSLMLNGSYIISEVNLGDQAAGQSNIRPLQGQSRYIVNAGLSYYNVASELQVTVNHNVIGERIFLVGFEGYPDIYEMPRNVLDLTISKKLSNKVQVKAGVADILNQEVLLLQDHDQRGLDRANDNVIQRYAPGRLYNIGITYNITKN